MNYRPIIFLAPMIRALLAGTKTQTRRIVKPQPDLAWMQTVSADGLHRHGPADARPRQYEDGEWGWSIPGASLTGYRCPYGVVGDLLWCRETHYGWSAGYVRDGRIVDTRIDYRATEPDSPCGRWTPSIHMPRWASRLTLRLTDVRVQRLQEISEEDAIAEGWPKQVDPGADTGGNGGPLDWYRGLWNSINGPGAWERNEWCWCLSFDVIRANVDDVLREAA
jgi:hypothetical protein